jgi:hypothetical protein
MIGRASQRVHESVTGEPQTGARVTSTVGCATLLGVGQGGGPSDELASRVGGEAGGALSGPEVVVSATGGGPER